MVGPPNVFSSEQKQKKRPSVNTLLGDCQAAFFFYCTLTSIYHICWTEENFIEKVDVASVRTGLIH